MLGIVCSDGKALPSIWIKGNLNGKQYKQILGRKVFPALNSTYGHGQWVWQQDGAPCHTSNDVQKYLMSKLVSEGFWPKDFWPPSLPNLNPLDYHVWMLIEDKACANAHSSVDDLKKSVEAVWNSLSQKNLHKACHSFRGRLVACIEADGGIFEK